MRNTSLFALLALTASMVLAGCTTTRVPAGFDPKPSFADEFEGTELDTTKWMQRAPGVRDNCNNVPDSNRVHDGMLTITTFSEVVAGKVENYCGMISTKGSLSQTYGYWEASLRFHRVSGNQVAFWIQSDLMGSDLTNPEKSGVEMDVFEHLAEAGAEEFDHAIHWNGYGAAHRVWSHHGTLASLDDGEFHVFAVAWTPDGYTFTVDGDSVEASDVPVSTALEYVILSSLVPRAFPPGGFGSYETSQATFDVDYVRVYPYIGKQ